jgi:hypothetical protein
MRRNKQLRYVLLALLVLQVWARAEAGDAWLNKVGSPAEAAAWVQQDPALRLGQQLRRHLPEDMAGWLQH